MSAPGCVAEADERKLRSLTPGAVDRLLVSRRGLEISLEPRLREIALDRGPAELHERVK
jgi:hypothetical protein